MECRQGADAAADGAMGAFCGRGIGALGVEAIANMTGIMVPPVSKTANKAIWRCWWKWCS